MSIVVSGASRLILLRHGRTEWNATGRFQGQADISLDSLGREQARLAGLALRDAPISEVWSSDLSRAHETARAVAAHHDLPVRTDRALREIHVGTWEGLTSAQVAELDPTYGQRYASGEDVRRSATGETTREVGDRVAAKLGEIAAGSADGATVLIGIHGLAALSGSLTLLGFPYEAWFRFASLTNCHWIDLRRGPTGAWRQHAWNVGPEGFVDGEVAVRSTEQELIANTASRRLVDVTSPRSSG